ncbi:MAG: hypothetical protein KAV87_24230 [Desulfobacteraceae bacterium]|nr:hypothetical protein [Desulfobacteraceae bacterium]
MSDNRTLDEVKADDIDQLEQVVKSAQLFEFWGRDPKRAREKAYKFQGACVQVALKNLGVEISRNINPKFVDKQLADKGIKCEMRRYHEENDVWRTGLFIYKKDGELAFYVSNVKRNNPSPFSINRVQKWGVLTNVPVDGGRSAISLPGMPMLGGSKGKRGSHA